MATLRPQIIRADTLDLQDHETPSAQDHTQQPYHPEPLGAGPPAPHQGSSLRHLEEDRTAEQGYLADAWGSGRSSHEGSDLLNEEPSYYDDDDDDDEVGPDDGAIQPGVTDSADSADINTDTDDDLMDDRISSSPSIPDDDAAEQDDGFVWALHNFVATVEGQANATKGDVMVLLDDSNSYWWLVRVVKDSSIGYLPAEHIETHQERLARYNKHRNLEFSQTMLSDAQEKSKNPLKKAMRRRNAKQVQFSTPTFYDPPSEGDWSDAENESDREEDRQTVDTATETQSTDQIDNGDEIESLGPQSNALAAEDLGESTAQKESSTTTVEGSRSALDASRPDQDALDQEPAPKRSRNGTMRNTDSFFNDNTAEPRKISLTPNLLREGNEDNFASNGNVPERASDSQESFEHIEKPSSSSSTEKSKEDKKKKDKRPGMLSGLFKRKDKKIKVDEAAGGTVVKHEHDSGSPTLTPGDTGSPSGRISPTAGVPQSPQQTKRPPSGGKLSKAPPVSTTKQASATGLESAEVSGPISTEALSSINATQEDSSRDLQDRSGPLLNDPSGYLSTEQPATTKSETEEEATQSFSSNAVSSSLESQQRDLNGEVPVDLHSYPRTTSTDQDITTNSEAVTEIKNTRNLQTSTVDYANNSGGQEPSPMPGSFSHAPPTRGQQQRSEPTAASWIPSSNGSLPQTARTPPELISTNTNSSTSSTNAVTPTRETSEGTWNAIALKSYIDGQSNDDAKNMLILIQNQNQATPLPLDHPTMLALGYHEQQKRLNEMSSQLDGLLQGFLARRAARPKATQR